MNPGYWVDTYWDVGYWDENYWADYLAVTTVSFVATASVEGEHSVSFAPGGEFSITEAREGTFTITKSIEGEL